MMHIRKWRPWNVVHSAPLFLSVLILMCSCLCVVVFAAEESPRKTIKAGYFPFDGYHMVDEKGMKSGYGYEILQAMRTYENWNYEYIGYKENKNWYDMQVMLERGEIDLVTSATVTTDRLRDFSYSHLPIGTSSTRLAIKAGNYGLDTDDYSNWDGIRVGMLANNSRNDSFDQYAGEHGFTYEKVIMETQEELARGLQQGTVDVIVTSNLLRLDNVWTLDQFDQKPFYVIVKKDNEPLLGEINDAIMQLYKDNPTFREDLYEKYYSSEAGGIVSFTRREQKLIDQCQEDGRVFYAVVNPDRKPLSYYEDGEMKGLLVDICKEVFARTGINVEIVPSETREDYIRNMNDGRTNIICDFTGNSSAAEDKGYVWTSIYYHSTGSRLIRKDYDGVGTKNALVNSSITNAIMESHTDANILYLNSIKECRDAVFNRTVDYSNMYTRCAQEFVYADETNSLTCVAVPDLAMDFSIAVSDKEDSVISSVIKKGIDSITAQDVSQMSEDYTYFDKPKTSFIGLIYEQPLLIIAMVAIVLLCIFGLILTVINYRKRKEGMEANKKISDALILAEEANRAKTEFFSRMSHDMRTPMNGILGLAELSEQEQDIQMLQSSMNQIRESGKYLLGLINDTLDLQRIESGKLHLNPRIVTGNELMDGILAIIRREAEQKGVTFTLITEGIDFDVPVKVDAMRLNQIILNLLSNAVKFTPSGGCVEMRMESIGKEGSFSRDRITISDTGVGMSEEFLKNGIFKAFSQESNEVTTNYAGSGLGLSIAKSLVEMMGGTISVKSELGVGTTFTLEVSIERASEADIENMNDSEQKRHKDVESVLKGKRILLVEDHPLNVEIAKKLLRKAGCEVDWAGNGEEGVRAFRESEPGTYAAILMDIRMPVMDGLAAAREIRISNRNDAASIPIIAMTANAYEEDIRKSLEAGMNAHLAKPIEPGRLYETLVKWIQNSRANE